MGNTLTAESAFASVGTFLFFLSFFLFSFSSSFSFISYWFIAVFNILRQPLAQFPNVVSGFMEAQVSIARLEKFFASEELDPYLFISFLNSFYFLFSLATTRNKYTIK